MEVILPAVNVSQEVVFAQQEDAEGKRLVVTLLVECL